jgi:hypothetical protein
VYPSGNSTAVSLAAGWQGEIQFPGLEYKPAERRRSTNGVDEHGFKLGAGRGCPGLEGPAFPTESAVEPKDDCVMKTRTSRINLFLSVGAASLVALGATAQTPAPAATATPAAPSSNAAPAKLPYGVDAVVKLSRAHISEDITLNYIQNSGTIYNLGPEDIVYLRNEGVSDWVINAMLDQRQNVPVQVAVENTLQAQAAASANMAATANADPGDIQAAAAYFQPPPVYVQPVPVYVQPEPEYVPASTLYIIPYGSSK